MREWLEKNATHNNPIMYNMRIRGTGIHCISSINKQMTTTTSTKVVGIPNIFICNPFISFIQSFNVAIMRNLSPAQLKHFFGKCSKNLRSMLYQCVLRDTFFLLNIEKSHEEYNTVLSWIFFLKKYLFIYFFILTRLQQDTSQQSDVKYKKSKS